MPLIIDKALATDTFPALAPTDEVPATGSFLVSLDQLATVSSERAAGLGVRIEPDDELQRVHALFGGQGPAPVALVAISFPVFGDGRGYSLARILREQLRYRGPLRAVGQVLFDQLFFMQRCGFDQFDLGDRSEAYAQDALARAFGTFSVVYQEAADQREADLRVRSR